MKQEITIVTAFFSINRENWKGFERSNEKYFEYFKGWAKLKNNIIVYVESEELRKKILEFRSSMGLSERTTVNVIPNVLDIDKELYQSIRQAADNNDARLFRIFPKNPDCWNAEYDYIMLMKMWCCADAVKRGQVEEHQMLAWMDFGYNHGGAVLDIKSDFNFLWEYDFPDKMNVFLIQPIDERPIFDIIFSMDTYIMGMAIVGIAGLWDEFWQMMKRNMMRLNSCGIIDDDQNVILMCLREKPEMFNTYMSSWQMPLKQFGGEHLLTIADNNETRIHKALRRTRYKYKVLKYAIGIFNYYSQKTVH